MPTVGEVIDGVYRDYLYPPDDQPPRIEFDADVTDTATTWSYSDSLLAVDEQEMLGPGLVVEAGTEQALVTAVDTTNKDLTVSRGFNATTASSHSSGDLIVLAPPYSRKTVFDAVSDQISALYPRLQTTRSYQLTTSSDYVEVPASVITVMDLLYSSGGDWISGSVALRDPFPPATSGKAVQFVGVPSGKTAHLIYRGKFDRPESETDEVYTLGITDDFWVRIVKIGAAAQTLTGRELDSAQQAHLTEQLRTEGYPVLSAVRQASALWQTRDQMMDEAARAQRSQHPPTVERNTLSRPGVM